MKFLPLIAIACALAACEYKREVVQQPAPAATVVTPPGTAVVTTPAPASSTTVYTR